MDTYLTPILDSRPQIWGPAILLMIFGLWLLRPYWRAYQKQRRREQLIAGMGLKWLRDVILEDSVGALVHIDYLILTQKGLVAIDVMTNEGIIFGGDGIEQWSQVNGRRTTRFANPLEHNRERVFSVRDNIDKGLNVEGRVLFDGACSFPKGRPGGVVLPEDVSKPVEEAPVVAAPLQAAWEALAKLSVSNTERFADDVALLRGSTARGRYYFALFTFVVAAGWVGWRLLLT